MSNPLLQPLPTVCVLAGGLGTRLGSRAGGLPKPLVKVAGKPFLLHQLFLLARAGFEKVVLCVGFKGELIEQAIGHQQWGMTIEYSYDGAAPCGTLRAVRQAHALLGERFLCLYGDTYLNIDYRRVVQRWDASAMPAMMTVLHNRGKWAPSNVVLRSGRIQRYNKDRPTRDMEWIDYGLGGLSREVLGMVDEAMNDLSDLQRELADRGLLSAIEVGQRFYEIGTPQALEETEAYIASLSEQMNR